MIRLLSIAITFTVALATGAQASDPSKNHGISAFGDFKYNSDFKNFEYVNPDAPKGGTIRLAGIDSFDSLNPYILKGVPVAGIGLIHATLMERANDEPDALYGLIAETVSVASDKSAITFNLRPMAKFSDGSPITAGDVVFTFQTLIKKGHPQYRFIFAGVANVKALSKHRVKFTFKAANNRDLPLQIANLPVLSKRYYDKVPFDKTTMTAPPGAGPYRVAKVNPGRSVLYQRIKNYWAEQLPVMRGRYNFNMVRFDYFRDRDIAFQAFFSKSYDFREEFTSRSWATQYEDKLPIKDGRIVRATLADETPSGIQAFFFNMRRKKFKDRRVRTALDLAFDFEWTNKTLFYGLYDRTNSMFANSALAAQKPPTSDEIKLLEPLRGKVPPEVFSEVYQSPRTDGSGHNRSNLRKATRLLRKAGWKIVNNKLVDKSGKPLTIEFLLFESSFQRIISPYVRNLKRLGIDARIRIVDVANFQHRMQQYDFDVVVQRYVQTNTPGIEQKTYFSSKMADVPGSRNLAGIKNPAIDYIIEKVIAAKSRKNLVTAVHALDRVLMWNRYMVPQWYKSVHNIAYWNKFVRPRVKPKFDLGMLDTWWYSAKKAAMIEAGKAPPKP
jgi:microcin C transport system substrate-binding protein